VVLRVIAEDEGLAGVALGVAVDRADVEEEDVLLAQHDAGLGVGHEVLGGVRAEPDDDPVPALPHAHLAQDLAPHRDGVLLEDPGDDLRGDRGDRLVDSLADVEQLLDRVVRPCCLVVNLGSHDEPLVARADR